MEETNADIELSHDDIRRLTVLAARSSNKYPSWQDFFSGNSDRYFIPHYYNVCKEKEEITPKIIKEW